MNGLRQLVILGMLILANLSIQAQKVTNVHAEQNGSKIEIYYNIEDSDPTQIFTVSVYYEDAKKMMIKPRSLAGDVGENVVGGKEIYLVIWDVLNDVDDLGDAEFFVRIEKQSKTVASEQKNTWFLGLNSAVGYTPYGVRLGYGGKWEFFLASRFGSDGFQQVGKQVTENGLNSFTLGIGRQILATPAFNLKVYVGGGLANWGNYKTYETKEVPGDASNYYQPTTVTQVKAGNVDKGTEVEYGLTYGFKKMQCSFGLTHNLGDNQNHTDVVLGLGLRF